jgi:hypothetical protein
MKQETIEEAALKATSYYTFPDIKKSHVESFIAGANWQAERMYSEEEVREAFRIGFNVGYNDAESPSYLTFEKWFEQFKKK